MIDYTHLELTAFEEPHFHDPFDPARHAVWLAALGHKPLPDGRCEHRWRNRTSRAVRCSFLEGFRAALSAPDPLYVSETATPPVSWFSRVRSWLRKWWR